MSIYKRGISKAADESRINSSIEGHLPNVISLTYKEEEEE